MSDEASVLYALYMIELHRSRSAVTHRSASSPQRGEETRTDVGEEEVVAEEEDSEKACKEEIAAQLVDAAEVDGWRWQGGRGATDGAGVEEDRSSRLRKWRRMIHAERKGSA
eukprot:Tamp_29987.p2 GENE.Tamp_29987~~Tamp_29987.p2  ORF type:complete len:112 (+),score=26.83 Tamp_29987:242-577(+)